MQNVVIQKSDLERDIAAGVYLSEATFSPSFLSLGGGQLCRFWIWSDTECKTPAVYGLQHDSTPPTPFQLHIVCIYCTLTQRRGERYPERKGEGQQGRVQITSWVENANMTECRQEIGSLQSINSACWTSSKNSFAQLSHLYLSVFLPKKIRQSFLHLCSRVCCPWSCINYVIRVMD